MRIYQLERTQLGPMIFFKGAGFGKGPWLTDETHALARASLGAWCVDGVVCGYTKDKTPAVVLINRRADRVTDGPFKGEPWVIGGRWDNVTDFPALMEKKVRDELFSGKFDGKMTVELMQEQPIMVAWGPGEGPLGHQGFSSQYVYRVTLDIPIEPESFRPDENHDGVTILKQGSALPTLSDYVRHLLDLSKWLR